MTKVHYTHDDIAWQLGNIINGMATDNWKPDYIVGLTRGGLVPATMLSHRLKVKLHTLDVSLRDDNFGPESNLWMAEDAFGYVSAVDAQGHVDVTARKNILLVDDINDTGATFKWIVDDWKSGCLPNDPSWDTVWGSNVRFATLINNAASNFNQVNYAGQVIDKSVNDEWCVFPWECWWE